MGKRFGNNTNRTLLKAEEGAVYAIITKSIGKNQFQVFCSDSMNRTASIRGNMIKKVWMKEGDIVLCSLREGSNKLCDIELKYHDHEVKTLKEGGYITDQLLNPKEVASTALIDFNML